MTRFWIGFWALIAATALSLAFCDARAEPPSGYHGMISGDVVICETREPVLAIAESARSGGPQGFADAVKRFAALPTASGARTCLATALPFPVHTGVTVDLGTAGTKEQIRMWAVEWWTDPAHRFWLLWREPVPGFGI